MAMTDGRGSRRGSTQPIGSMPSSGVGETRQLHKNASICMVCWPAVTIIFFWPAMAKKIDGLTATEASQKKHTEASASGSSYLRSGTK